MKIDEDTEFLITEFKAEPAEFEAVTAYKTPPETTTQKLMTILKTQVPTPVPLQGFKCQYCDNRFIDRAFVLVHIKQRHTFKCPQCSLSFPFKISLIKHQMAIHGPSANQEERLSKRNFSNFRHECDFCKLKFIDKKSLSVHVESKHSLEIIEKKKIQELGPKLKIGSQIIIKHVRKGSNQSVKQIPFQKEDSVNNQEVLKGTLINFSKLSPVPRQRSTNVPISVLVNNIRKQSLATHVSSPLIDQQENDPFGIPCLDCGLVLLPDRLLKHRSEFHEKVSESTLFTCDICGVQLKGKTSLITHMKAKHLPKAAHRCEFCLGLYSCHYTLVKHINRIHSNGNHFICHFCGEVFQTAQSMTDHRKAHYTSYKERKRNVKSKKS